MAKDLAKQMEESGIALISIPDIYIDIIRLSIIALGGNGKFAPYREI